MESLLGAVQYFYEQWLLRDVLGYVTPGAILLGVVGGQLVGWDALKALITDLPVLAYLPLFGVLFITGFALQNVGEGLGLLRWHDRKNDQAHLETLHRFHSQNISVEGDPKSGAGSWTERTRERISVKKNMAGTGLMALLFSSIFTLVYQGVRLSALDAAWQAWTPAVLGALLAVLLGWGLFRGHRRQHRNQTIWENLSMAVEQKAAPQAEKDQDQAVFMLLASERRLATLSPGQNDSYSVQSKDKPV